MSPTRKMRLVRILAECVREMQLDSEFPNGNHKSEMQHWLSCLENDIKGEKDGYKQLLKELSYGEIVSRVLEDINALKD